VFTILGTILLIVDLGTLFRRFSSDGGDSGVGVGLGMCCIVFLEDVPQLVLSVLYLVAVDGFAAIKEAGLDSGDALAMVSFALSIISLLVNGAMGFLFLFFRSSSGDKSGGDKSGGDKSGGDNFEYEVAVGEVTIKPPSGISVEARVSVDEVPEMVVPPVSDGDADDATREDGDIDNLPEPETVSESNLPVGYLDVGSTGEEGKEGHGIDSIAVEGQEGGQDTVEHNGDGYLPVDGNANGTATAGNPEVFGGFLEPLPPSSMEL
jgi:hypothetical protein